MKQQLTSVQFREIRNCEFPHRCLFFLKKILKKLMPTINEPSPDKIHLLTKKFHPLAEKIRA